MQLVAFAGALLAAVLVSVLANRTILSTAVLFLVVGVVLGPETISDEMGLVTQVA